MIESTLTPLCELARKHGTDKGGWHLKAGDTCHNYTPTYHELFKDRREQVKHVLEIGIGHGGSLRMWRDYFPNAQIVGLDNNPMCLFDDERIRCFHADQSNTKSVVTALQQVRTDPWPGWDLIVDDGSHITEHQIYSAQLLLPFMEPDDGRYVIEDIRYDCRPEFMLDAITHQGYWEAYNTGIGLGRAHCECGCSPPAPEVLLVGRH